jgi:hypothetical protein
MMGKLITANFIIPLVGVIMAIGSCNTSNAEEQMSQEKEEVQIIVYQQGKKTVLDPQLPRFSELQRECERLLTTADNMLRLGVSPNTIFNIKEKEAAIELIYPGQKRFVVLTSNREIQADHLLVQLRGHYAGESTAIIFYGEPYSSGPYTKKNGLAKIKQLLQAMGINLN